MQRFVVHVDGAVGSDGGKRGAGVGAVIRDEQGRVRQLLKSWVPGPITNNEAEYAALLLALRTLAGQGPCQVTVLSDSQIMVKQLRGEARVRSPSLQPLYEEACALMQQFAQIEVAFLPREQNRLADALAWEAADGWRNEKQSKGGG